MSTLFVDAGNTNLKWQLEGAYGLHNCPVEQSEGFLEWIRQQSTQVTAVAVGSVQSEGWNSLLRDLCKDLGLECWFAESQTEAMGLVSAYSNPVHLGVDRWLAMQALWNNFQAGFVLVDAGTAITLDVVNADGQHQGGYILPGMELQRHALSDVSEKLRSLAKKPITSQVVLGKDSAEAMNNGVLASALALVEKVMRQASVQQIDQLVFTGGDASKLMAVVDKGVVLENLVLQGLEITWQQRQSGIGAKS